MKPVLQRKAPQRILAAFGEWVTKTTDDPQSIVSTCTQLTYISVLFLDEEAVPEEDENEENPFATEFQEDQEAAYLKDPKKALQGFYDREVK